MEAIVTLAAGILVLVSALVHKLTVGWLRGMLLRFASEVKDAVADVSRVYVDEVRKASADGVLTLEEKANAKKMAIAAVKLNFGIQGLKRLVRILGVTDVDGWLGGHVDVEVAVQKATKT